MMQAMQVSSPLVGGSLMSSPVVRSERTSFRGSSLTKRSHSLTVCELDSDKLSGSSSESSRRNFMMSSVLSFTGATAVGLISQPNSAQAAKRKPPAPPEEKPSTDEKYLSAYDAKVLANIRRKEALRAQLDVQKAKAKVVREPVQPPQDIYGQVPTDDGEGS